MKGMQKTLILFLGFLLISLSISSPALSQQQDQTTLTIQKWLQERQKLFDEFFDDDDAFGSSQHVFDEMQKMQERMMKTIQNAQKNNTYTQSYSTGIQEITQETKGDKTIIRIKIPNLDQSTVKVRIIDNHLQIDGDVTSQQQNTYLSGSITTSSQMTSHFSRSYPLPYKVDPSLIDLKYEKNEILVILPK